MKYILWTSVILVSFLQFGHFWLRVNHLSMHFLQKMCPHKVNTGFFGLLMQMEHLMIVFSAYFSSGSEISIAEGVVAVVVVVVIVVVVAIRGGEPSWNLW